MIIQEFQYKAFCVLLKVFSHLVISMMLYLIDLLQHVCSMVMSPYSYMISLHYALTCIPSITYVFNLILA